MHEVCLKRDCEHSNNIIFILLSFIYEYIKNLKGIIDRGGAPINWKGGEEVQVEYCICLMFETILRDSQKEQLLRKPDGLASNLVS